jgi:hypothetical protein
MEFPARRARAKPCWKRGMCPAPPNWRRRAAVPDPRVNQTPHSISPKPAVRIVRKVSPVAGRAAFSGSVISTSLFGSAPWSPPPLTVEVMAQIVTVPLGLTRPVMLCSPSAATGHGWPVAAATGPRPASRSGAEWGLRQRRHCARFSRLFASSPARAASATGCPPGRIFIHHPARGERPQLPLCGTAAGPDTLSCQPRRRRARNTTRVSPPGAG